MLTPVINPGGTARIVKIAGAPSHFGVETRGPGLCPDLTPGVKRLHRRERRRRLQERQEPER